MFRISGSAAATLLAFCLPASAGPGGCSPGLAAAVPCPQSRAPTLNTVIRKNPLSGENYIAIDKPSQLGLDPSYNYYRSGGQTYRVSPQTGKVMGVMPRPPKLLK